jgi:hypothetical protein
MRSDPEVSPGRTVAIDEPDRTKELSGKAAEAAAPGATDEMRPRPPARKQRDLRPGEHVQAVLFEDLFRRTP